MFEMFESARGQRVVNSLRVEAQKASTLTTSRTRDMFINVFSNVHVCSSNWNGSTYKCKLNMTRWCDKFAKVTERLLYALVFGAKISCVVRVSGDVIAERIVFRHKRHADEQFMNCSQLFCFKTEMDTVT